MFVLFALLKLGGILGGLLIVGFFMLPTATALQVVGGGWQGSSDYRFWFGRRSLAVP